MGEIYISYVGYKDMSAVKKRNLKTQSVYADGYEKHMSTLCYTQKIGNGNDGCKCVEDTDVTQNMRSEGIIKSNHHVWNMYVEVSEEDNVLYMRAGVKRGMAQEKTPDSFLEWFFGGALTTGGSSCPTGFCD